MDKECKECIEMMKKGFKIVISTVIVMGILGIIFSNRVDIQKLKTWQKNVIKDIAVLQTKVEKLNRVVLNKAEE